MYKKIYFFIISIVLIMFTSGCRKSFYSEYKGAYLLEKDHIYEEISLDELYEKSDNKESFVVYYGQRACSVCYASVGFIDKNAKECGVNTIYYLKSKILGVTGDDDRVAQMQAKIGFDEENSPTGAPRLWCFIDGKYETGMASFLQDDEYDWLNASKRLFEYYITNTKKGDESCTQN